LSIAEEQADSKLEKAVHRKNAITIIGAVASVTAHNCGRPSHFQLDDALDLSEERNLPLHAAINQVIWKVFSRSFVTVALMSTS